MKGRIITDHTLIIDKLETSIKSHNLNFILGFLPKGSYLVGGYIRDIILGRRTEMVDVDIVVPVDAILIEFKGTTISKSTFSGSLPKIISLMKPPTKYDPLGKKPNIESKL